MMRLQPPARVVAAGSFREVSCGVLWMVERRCDRRGVRLPMPSESSMDVARMTRDIETRHFLRLTDDGQTTIRTNGAQKRVGGGGGGRRRLPLNIACM